MEKIFWQTDRKGMINNSFGHMGGIGALLLAQEGPPAHLVWCTAAERFSSRAPHSWRAASR